MEAYVIQKNRDLRLKQEIRFVAGTLATEGRFFAAFAYTPTWWDLTQKGITTKWRAALELERAKLRTRLAELDAMDNAGPVFRMK